MDKRRVEDGHPLCAQMKSFKKLGPNPLFGWVSMSSGS